MSRFMGRRDALRIAGAAMITLASDAAASRGRSGAFDQAPADDSLHALAAAKGLRFGSAMAARQLDDPRYCAIIREECGLIVAENEHKWYAIQPERGGEFNFGPADRLVAFAKTNRLAMRGHTLVWHHPKWMPKWLPDLRSAKAAEALLGGYIDRVSTRYHPFLTSWDVVNETVDEKTGDLRETQFSRVMGPQVIDFCFRRAAAAMPGTQLVYNDYMSWESGSANHRRGVLKLLERLRRSDVPIHALGIQSHSNYEMPNEFTADKRREWRLFCDEVVAMDLDLLITEFDVNDNRLAPDVANRDRIIADYTKDYMDIMLSYPRTKDVLAWGLVDKDSWLQNFLPRADGQRKRPTVYDASYRPKPMRDAIAAAFRGAPTRSRT